MQRYVHPVWTFLKREDGPTAVEYAVMLAFIIAVCVGAITNLGKNTNTAFTSAAAVIPNSSGS
jgi:pilus assembly protein Flp/PilA